MELKQGGSWDNKCNWQAHKAHKAVTASKQMNTSTHLVRKGENCTYGEKVSLHVEEYFTTYTMMY